MSALSKTVLLTGFGPFPGVTENVSSTFVAELARVIRQRHPRLCVLQQELPTVWQLAPRQLEELYFAHRPTIALHFGVSHLAHAMTVECRAQNKAHKPDATGDGPPLQILAPDRPAEVPVTLPAARLVARMRRAAVPAILSQDAGAYLCNAVLYHSLELMRVLEIQGACGFIHLPTTLARRRTQGSKRQTPRLTFEQAIDGGVICVETLL